MWPRLCIHFTCPVCLYHSVLGLIFLAGIINQAAHSYHLPLVAPFSSAFTIVYHLLAEIVNIVRLLINSVCPLSVHNSVHH